MRPIPAKLRNEMDADPFYHQCAVSGAVHAIEWHHNLIYGGRQVNEKWAIIPITHEVHEKARNKDTKEVLDWIMLNRATDKELLPYCKAIDYIFMKKRLNEKYGEYKM